MSGPAQPPRGMRDLGPDQMRQKTYVCDLLRDVFETFGFEPFDTPALEYRATLEGKYGPDAERLIYHAGLRDADDLALRYDLSVPLARHVASATDLTLPFKRFQIAKIWRGDRPQRGRYREITQADIDIVGSSSMEADAEIIVVLLTALERLGLSSTVTKVNNRKLLAAIGAHAGVAADLLPGMYRAIDKEDKIGVDGVRIELRAVGLPGELLNRMRQAVEQWLKGSSGADEIAADLQRMGSEADPRVAAVGIETLLERLGHYTHGGGDSDLGAARREAIAATVDAMRSAAPSDRVLSGDQIERVMSIIAGSGGPDRLNSLAAELDGADAASGLGEVDAILRALTSAGFPAGRIEFHPAMVRGLDYYTGTIFETVVTDPPIGSLTGGGRFDGLAGLFGRSLPAVGTSLGVDRLLDVLAEHRMLGSGERRTEVFVTRFDDSQAGAAIALASELRLAGIRTEVQLGPDSLGDQIRRALARGIGLLLIVGPDELARNEVVIRDLVRGEQWPVQRSDVVRAVREAAS